MSEYYTLGAQLPSLKKGDYRGHMLTSREFVETLTAQASRGDKKQVELLLLREDNALLLRLLRDRETKGEEGKIYVLGEERLRYLIEATEKKLEAERDAVTIYQELYYPRLPKGVYPKYMIDFVERYLSEQMDEVDQPYFYADLLLMAYAEYVQKKGNKFLRRWFKLEYDIAAIFAAMSAEAYQLDKEKYILGTSTLHQLLREGNWGEITYTDEGELYHAMHKIAEEEDLALREQGIDHYKWDRLDEVTFTDIFSINAMLAYLLKLQMLERWEMLDKVQGEERFRSIVYALNSDFKEDMKDFKKSLKHAARAKKLEGKE